MAETLHHRGPDDAGDWLSEGGDLALAHRRLSVIELSHAGHQPMRSPCGRYTLVYNGEIYNHIDLRAKLEEEQGQFDWRGHSDTETLLAALRHWGVKGALQRLNGMFAFALWDASERTLTLARDRLGEKPLYYGVSGGLFLFASELKALRVYPRWKAEIDRDALSLYLRYNYIPAPWSIYQGVKKLPPAHYVLVREGGRIVSPPHCYWNLASISEEGAAPRGDADLEDLADELDSLLGDAVRRRMVADVPLGVFLSGGFDSTMVTALMQAQSDRPVKTFTIGFHEHGYNEAGYARAVADHLGTDHTELYVSAEEAMAVVPRLPAIWDEPFSDISQIPTLLVSELARSRVTVSLSGDGGDELFCGYNRYTQGYQIWQWLQRIPKPLHRPLASLMEHLPGAPLEAVMGLLPQRMRIPHLSDRITKLAEVMRERSAEAYYHRLVSHWTAPNRVVRGATEPWTIYHRPEGLPTLADFREQMMYIDSITYLPDDILVKVDRATMAVSLEARAPLLDHRVVEFAWRLPLSLKCRDGEGKWLLREVLYRYVPKHLMERPKMGFGVPIDEWLKGSLRDWAEGLLDERRLQEEGLFDPGPIRQRWKEHLEGKRHWHHCLWNVLMFQAWLETQKTTGVNSASA